MLELHSKVQGTAQRTTLADWNSKRFNICYKCENASIRVVNSFFLCNLYLYVFE